MMAGTLLILLGGGMMAYPRLRQIEVDIDELVAAAAVFRQAFRPPTNEPVPDDMMVLIDRIDNPPPKLRVIGGTP